MTTLRSLTCYVLLFAFTQFTAAQSSSEMAAPSAQLFGYTAQTSTPERDWEKKFQDGIVAANIRENDRRLSARPHHVGSPYDKDNAEWILARFKEWGFDAHIETFDVLFPTPKERVLELVEPTKFTRQAARTRARRRSHFEPERPSNFPPTTPIRSTAT